ncbi:Vitamin B12 import ATP-binding protein BtuD [Clostridium haemolyticum]|uniref:ABC transporter ATP-binding protein n=1 Tax=Clostridium haemolyticum TaxID=84025 RepID=UPI001C3ADF7B|nr:ATP-binding cassette domain-containing protein [Clostridium haemolyticum]CAG7841053.1 Vitamin B12 import ATP-binding protein BtuD [Clostridium haemolyticum]
MSFLTLKDIQKCINKQEILKNINIHVKEGEFLILLGSSGCGKTTLLRIISGLEDGFTGKIYYENKDITKLQCSKRGFGIVFQSYSLFPNMTVEQNVSYGLKNKKYSKNIINEKVNEILNIVEMKEYKRKYPHELSGGQQQRVALARTLVLSPKVLLLDEPLSALDYRVRVSLRKQIKEIHERLNITTIMVTHDKEEALVMADRIAIMNKGEIIQIDSPENIYVNPINKYVAHFMGELNYIKGFNDKLSFIRPENIEYSFEKRENYKEAVIKSIEFRGEFYRVSVESMDKNIKLNVKFSDKDKLKEKIYIRYCKNTYI